MPRMRSAGNVKRTACSHNCWDTCPLDVTVLGNRIMRLVGARDNEVTRGFCCSRARMIADRAICPSRPLQPMARRDRRGGLQPVDWAEALDMIADRLSGLRDNPGSQSVLYHNFSGSQALLKNLDTRFFNLYGGVTRPSGSLCWSAGLSAQRSDFGAVRAHDPLDHRHARTIVLWGRNPFATNPHLIPILSEARSRGAFTICIDPLRTRTARWADIHIPIKPGMDQLLAAAVCRRILSRSRYDHDFVDNCTTGLDAFVEHLGGLPGEDELEAMTGVGSSVVQFLADRYAAARPVATLAGYGLQRHSRGALAVRMIDALAALTGNIGAAGGGVNYATLFVREGLADVAGPSVGVRHVPWPRLADEVPALDNPPIEAMIVSRSNPLSQLPDLDRTRAAVMGIPFVVVIDNRFTATAAVADVFLPCTVMFEEEDVHNSSWHNYVTYGQQVIEPPPGVKSDLGIWAELASRLGFGRSFPDSPRYWAGRLLAPLKNHGVSPGSLLGRTIRYPGAPDVAWEDGQFLTGSGLFTFVNEPIRAGVTADERFPFILLSPQSTLTQHSQMSGNSADRSWVSVSARRAGELGLAPGDPVRVVSAVGELTCLTDVSLRVGDDVVTMAQGTDSDGRGVNVLVPYASSDEGSCMAYYDCVVRLEPLAGPAGREAGGGR